MNSVSWFIYIAQVSNSLGIMFIVLGIIGAMTIGIFVLVATVHASVEVDDFKPILPKARYVALIVLFFMLGNLMPERNTMYAIAASQVGERIANSEAVRGIADDATKALHLWIRRQIDPKRDAAG